MVDVIEEIILQLVIDCKLSYQELSQMNDFKILQLYSIYVNKQVKHYLQITTK